MIQVFDDIVPEKLAQKIEEYTLGKEVKWELERATMIPEFNVKDPNLVEFLQFRHIIKHADQKRDQHAYRFVLQIFERLSVKYGIMINDPFRVKYNLLPRIEKFKELQYNTPHVDAADSHYGLIYYVCDSDGDTIIFDQTSKEHPMERASLFKNFTIKEKISPKRGRLVLFDGDQYHTSSHPTENDLRCIINIDVLKRNVKML
jgi:hypothetical protein